MITQTTKLATASTLAVLATSLSTFAGDSKQIIDKPLPPQESKTWCDALKTIGTIYKNNENPYIQEFKLSGRYHYEAGSIAGDDVNNEHFNHNFDIHRRARIGASVKFAQFFKLLVKTQLVADGRYKGKDLTWGQPDEAYEAYDEVFLSFNAKKAFSLDGLDKLDLTYGRQKFLVGAEVHQSSKKIKTIERSALANSVYGGALPAGFTVSATKGSWKVNASVYSDVLADNEWDSIIGDWNGGEGYLVNVTKTFDNKDKLIIDAFYHHDTNKGKDWFNNNWLGSVTYQGKRGPWGFFGNVIVGDHTNDTKADRRGHFYGFITQGTYSFLDDQLELVGQYQWQGSNEAEGVRAYSKAFASGGDHGHGGNVNKGYGDSHHSLYAGVNWYICSDHAKVMLGVEYDNLDTPKGKADATTLWTAFRMYF